MTATVLVLIIIAFSLAFIGFTLQVKFSCSNSLFLSVICPITFYIIGGLIFFTPPVRAQATVNRHAIEKQQQEIKARNNRCIDDLSKRYNLSPETIKFLMDNGKIPCPPVN